MKSYIRITPNYILKHRKPTIKKYKKTWHSDVIINTVPMDVDLDSLQTILNTMIDTGYTFIASYLLTKCTADFIHEKDIDIPEYFTKPGKKKIQAKKEELVQHGEVKPIILNSSHRLLDGYATFIMLRQCGERYIPYIVDDNYYTNKSRCSNIDEKLYLYTQQDGKCYICGRQTYMNQEHRGLDDYATVDHIVPLAKGGENNISNMAISCNICNNLKGQFRFSEALREVITQELKERGML